VQIFFLWGVGLFDLLAVTGNVSLNGSLNITFIDDFELGLNQFYQILTADGTQSGQFTGLDEGGLVGTFNSINLFITYEPENSGGVDGVAVYSVPEPSSALLILLGAGALLARRMWKSTPIRSPGGF